MRGALHWGRLRSGRCGKPRLYEKRRILMKIGVLFFGVLKEVIGRSSETVDLPEGARVREVLFYYAREAPRFEAMVPSLAISVNQEYSGADRALRDGDEVGLLPPVSGGSAQGGELRGEVKIVRERIDAEAVVRRLKQPADGAAVIFDGVVRDNTRGRRTLYLDYETYEPLALWQMESLAAEGGSG